MSAHIVFLCIYTYTRAPEPRGQLPGGMKTLACKVAAPFAQIVRGAARGQEVRPFLYKSCTSKHACYRQKIKLRTVLLSNVARILTSCSEMNVKSADIRSIPQPIARLILSYARTKNALNYSFYVGLIYLLPLPGLKV